MDKRNQVTGEISRQGLLPLYFHHDSAVCAETLKALYHAGCRVVEFTNRGKAALDNFKKLRELRDRQLQGMWLGAGTIKDARAATDFLDAGADFLISPGLPEDVFDIAYAEKVLWIPGCMTPTEIMKAESFGIGLIKLFPGNLLGPSFVKSVKEIFPGLLFLPTGGVELDKENLREWFASGVCAVGMGSRLVSASLLEKKAFEEIDALAGKALRMIREIRK